jgi:uncharacterized protein (DUF2384 family)
MAHALADSVWLRKAEIIAHATESLDGRKNAMDWLQKPSPNMVGRTPLEVLDQGEPEELQQLDDVLTALDYGMHT